jgi:hypothetical protein
MLVVVPVAWLAMASLFERPKSTPQQA